MTGDDLQLHSGASPNAEVSRPAELPRDLADFTGRELVASELEAAVGESPNGSPRVVNLYGMGGAGKTTLAVHVAHRVASEFVDGQLFVDLQAYRGTPRTAFSVLGDFLASLGRERSAIPPELSARTSLYRSLTSKATLLVVLDNALSADQVLPLLPSSPSSSIVVTSRNRLGEIPGAAFFHLGVMSPPEATALFSRIAGKSRVAGEAEASTQVLALTGFLPLGIRVSGAFIAGKPHRTIAALAGDLRSQRASMLDLGKGINDIRSMFMTSFAALPCDQQDAFRILGLVEGPDTTAWELAALLDVPYATAEQLLEALVDAELVGTLGQDATGVGRYRLHDLLREFAADEARVLPVEVRNDAICRLLGAYLAVTAEAEDRFQPGEVRKRGSHLPHHVPGAPIDAMLADPVLWVSCQRLVLLAGIGQAYREGLWDATWTLGHTLAPFYEALAYWDDWEETGALALAAAEHGGTQTAVGIILIDLAALDRDRGDLDAALTKYGHALDLFTAAEDQHGRAYAHLGRALVHRNRHEWLAAEEYLESSLDGLTKAGDRRLAAQALRSLALVETGAGKYGEAREHFAQALAIFQELGDRRAEAYAWRGLGNLMLSLRELDGAHDAFLSSLRIVRQLHDRRGEARAMIGLGQLEGRRGNRTDGGDWLDKARVIGEAVGDRTLLTEVEEAAAALPREA